MLSDTQLGGFFLLLLGFGCSGNVIGMVFSEKERV